MLLSLMRKHAKSWLIKALIAIIAIVFVFYFGYSFSAREGIKLALVNDEVITAVEYQKSYRSMLEALQREYRGMWSDNLVKVFDLKNRAMDALITQKLVSQEAKKIGLDVSEKEVQDKIMSNPSFQFRGRFDESRYRAVLQNHHMTPEEFEVLVAREMIQDKVEQLLTTLSPVTDQEVLEQYTFANEKVKISYVEFKPDQFKSKITVEPAAMEKYFEDNKETYRIPEKVKVAFVVFDPDAFKDQVKVSEDQLKDYYEDNLDTFKEKKQVKARHILFRLAENASKEEEEKVRQKATSVLEQARAGSDFAELAKKNTEDPSGKENGGDLGYFSPGQMVKPFEDAAFKLKKDEISDLVRSAFGYHIIKVEDVKEAKTKTLEEARGQILSLLQKTATTDMAHEKALSFVDRMPYQADLLKYAAESKVPVRETGYFSQKDAVPEIGSNEKLKQTLFSMERDEPSDLVDAGGKFYVFQVKDKKPSALPALEEVKDKVKEEYVLFLANQAAKSAGEEYLRKLKEGKDWPALAKESGLETRTTEFISRQDTIPQIGYFQELQEAAFGLSQKKRYAETVFQNDKGVFVIRWEGEQDVDRNKFEEEKKLYRDMLARLKNQSLFKEWIEHLKSRAKIEMLQPLEG
ncbi:MAG: peptidylprolyl isomerase [Deltaproteobacteria bacterium]|nr:peptidylprolyl isomerase [Deltaproteobacteria bacterium]